MAKEIVDIKKELQNYKYEFNLLQKIPFTNKENKYYQKLLKNGGTLPEGVYQVDYAGTPSEYEFYTVHEEDLTEAEIREYLTYKQLSLIRTIKNCIVFFTVVTIIGMVTTLLVTLGAIK